MRGKYNKKGNYVKGSTKRISQVRARKSITRIRARRVKRKPFVSVDFKRIPVKEIPVKPRKRARVGLWWLGVPSDGSNTMAVGVFPDSWDDELIYRWIGKMPEFGHILFISEFISPEKPSATHYYSPYGKRRFK